MGAQCGADAGKTGRVPLASEDQAHLHVHGHVTIVRPVPIIIRQGHLCVAVLIRVLMAGSLPPRLLGDVLA